jgi:hypothetical protein
MNLAEIDFNAITTGVMSCPRCDWSRMAESLEMALSLSTGSFATATSR